MPRLVNRDSLRVPLRFTRVRSMPPCSLTRSSQSILLLQVIASHLIKVFLSPIPLHGLSEVHHPTGTHRTYPIESTGYLCIRSPGSTATNQQSLLPHSAVCGALCGLCTVYEWTEQDRDSIASYEPRGLVRRVTDLHWVQSRSRPSVANMTMPSQTHFT